MGGCTAKHVHLVCKNARSNEASANHVCLARLHYHFISVDQDPLNRIRMLAERIAKAL
jgi:hypothetical protein